MNEANLKQSEQYMSALSSVKSKFDPNWLIQTLIEIPIKENNRNRLSL